MQSPYDQLANRFRRVHRHLRKWARRTGTTCYRLYEKDIADQPLIVDWYDGDVVVWALDRTRNETDADEDAWLAAVLGAVGRGLEVADDHVFVKRRARQADRQHGGQYQVVSRTGAIKEVEEAGLRFEVNLSDYLDTGLFLDHRPLRARVRAESAGKDVLNLFAYTGTFTCYAASGGAAGTTTVDLSNTYLQWCERNLGLNGFAIGREHRLVRADARAWLMEQTSAAFDLIVCDPPTFSNSTAMRGTFDVQRDHSTLLAACLAVLRPGGTLYFSTNRKGFRLDEGMAQGAGASDITETTIPEDFASREPHRCWRFVR
jgi:23S rRNA G2069 N7-methylase RlmK/C1962 C5-methylase RlmI